MPSLWVGGGFDGVVADGLGVAMAMLSPRDSTILYTNRAWDDLFGFGPGEALGQPASIVSADSPSERDRITRSMTAELARHGVWHGRVRKVSRSGEEFWSMTHVSTVQHPELGEVWVSLQMGPDQREEGDAHDLHEGLSRAGSWEFDSEAGSVRLSGETLRLLGMEDLAEPVPLGEMLARFHPEDVGRITDALGASQRDVPPDRLRLRVLLPDGACRTVEFLGVETQSRGSSRVFRGVVRGIDEVRDPLTDRALAERQRTTELEEIDEQKNLFLRAVSHDLRTPLTIMQGFASLLVSQDDRLDPVERRHYAARIEAGARRMQRQLNNLLDIDRLSRGVIVAERRPTDLRRLAVDVVEALDIADRVTVQGESVIASVDPAQVERITENLLANAARHAGPECRIEFRAETVQGGVVLLVEDDGPGVPPELRDDLFEVLHKASASSSGTGVGLPLVRRFAELHGGHVGVDDRDGGGAAFRVFLADP